MRLIRKFVFLLALVAHLGGSLAYAGPGFVEICTAHGVKILPSEDTDSDRCEICLAICDLAAIGTNIPTFPTPQATELPQPSASGIAPPSLLLIPSSRDPPRFV